MRTRGQRLVLTSLVLVAVIARDSGGALAADNTADGNKAVARRVFDDILNRGRYELFDDIYTKDFVKHIDRSDTPLAEEREDARSMRIAMADLVMTVDTMIAEGDRVAIQYTGRGTSTGPLSGMPPTGKKCVASGMTVYRFVDGKIAEEWTYYNMLDILRQLGYMSPAPTAVR